MAAMIWFNRMKTTLNLDDELLAKAKRRAAERGLTLTRLVEDGLRAVLLERRESRYRFRMPTVRGGPTAVDVADRDALYDFMERDDGPA